MEGREAEREGRDPEGLLVAPRPAKLAGVFWVFVVLGRLLLERLGRAVKLLKILGELAVVVEGDEAGLGELPPEVVAVGNPAAPAPAPPTRPKCCWSCWS